jgi:hypothetical protein
MLSSAIVGIGAGIGALFLCAACFIVFQIYKRKREQNREIAEIEQGFPDARPVEITQLQQGPGACQVPFRDDKSSTAFRTGQQSYASSFHLSGRADTSRMELPWTETENRTHAFKC